MCVFTLHKLTKHVASEQDAAGHTVSSWAYPPCSQQPGQGVRVRVGTHDSEEKVLELYSQASELSTKLFRGIDCRAKSNLRYLCGGTILSVCVYIVP